MDLSVFDPLEPCFRLNLLLGWLWMVGGFVAGALLGTGFQHKEWLGGYDSLRRRLYRLGHVAFFGTGILNLLFYGTAIMLGLSGMPTRLASYAFLAGALSMPVCCALVANFPRFKPAFAIPVMSLLTGGALTCWEVLSS